MNTNRLPLFLVLILSGSALFTSPMLSAQEVFISDECRAPFRTGPTDGYRIQGYLRSGLPVEELQVNSQSGYTQVKTRKGTEGWVPSSFISKTPIAKYQVVRLEKELQRVKTERGTFASEKSDLVQTSQALQQENNSLNEINNKLSEELKYIKQISSNTLSINSRNQELIENNQKLQDKIDLLSADNERLKDDTRQDFFLLGVGAILLGFFASGLLPMLKPRKKDTGWV